VSGGVPGPNKVGAYAFIRPNTGK